ncbi:hypothetical protein Ddc_19879 [Ditylenchus destructor]|nr:hypothetical protein Ddc_19879 [Ditylenchus destructor]
MSRMNLFIEIYWVMFLIVLFCKVLIISGDNIAATKTLYHAATKHLAADKDESINGTFAALLNAKDENAVSTEIQNLTKTFLGSLEILKQKNETSRTNNETVESEIAYVKRIEEDSLKCLSGNLSEKESESAAKERYESAKRLTLAALKYSCDLHAKFSECESLILTVTSSKLKYFDKAPLFAHLIGAQEDTDRCDQYITGMKFESKNTAWKRELEKAIKSLADAETVIKIFEGAEKQQKEKIGIKEKIGKVKEHLENIKEAFENFA